MSKLAITEKGKLVERQGRKAMGLKLCEATIARLPVFTTEIISL